MVKLTIFVASLVTVTWGAHPFNVSSPNSGGRIVGGNDTTIEKHPFMASILLGGQQDCGGTIISSTWILTAAHCIVTDASEYSVRVGSTTHDSGGEVIPAARILVHEDFSWYTIDFDVALIELARPITHPVFRTAVLAADEAFPVAGTTATVTGWGTTQTSVITNILQVIQVPIMSQSACRAAYGQSVTDSMMCTAVEGRGPCHGDSGGPLIANGVVTGTVSWGLECASAVNPSVYASVPALRAWIRKNSGV